MDLELCSYSDLLVPSGCASIGQCQTEVECPWDPGFLVIGASATGCFLNSWSFCSFCGSAVPRRLRLTGRLKVLRVWLGWQEHDVSCSWSICGKPEAIHSAETCMRFQELYHARIHSLLWLALGQHLDCLSSWLRIVILSIHRSMRQPNS